MSGLVASGDSTPQTAFARHVLPEVEVLYRVALSITRRPADAEDLVQDTLLRAFRSIETFDGRHPRAWLLTILRNSHISQNRRRRPGLLRRGDNEPDDVAPTTPESLVIDATLDAAVEYALRRLPARLARVVELVDINGLRYAEAAEVLGVPVGTIMSRLHRGRARMRARLVEAGLGPSLPRGQ